MFSMRKLALHAAFLIGLGLSGHAETLRIVVTGDGRAQYPWIGLRPGEDEDGLNQKINREICEAVIKEGATIMLWTGDIVNVNEKAGPGPEAKTNQLRYGLKKWREIMEPLYQNHVTVLPVRGNHEVEWHEEKDKTPNEIDNATAVWREVFPDLPPDGPECEKGLSFSFATDSILCLGLDPYENRRHLVHQSWLEEVLTENKKPFIFAFSHEPAFVTGGHNTNEECLAAFPHRRDRMLESLADAGARVFICGHDHFYDHMKVRRDTAPLRAEIHQFTVGTAGAPFYSHMKYPDNLPYPKDEDWKLEQVGCSDLDYGYILITIDGNTAIIEFKGREADGQYETRDTFSYTVGPP
jgi:hypothetical protein